MLFMERRLYGGPPCIPHQIYGYTFIDGVPQQATIQALINGEPQRLGGGKYETISGPNGHFGYNSDPDGLVFILDNDCWRRGKKVQFTLNGELANEVLIFENGLSSKLYLNVGTSPEPKILVYYFSPKKKATAGEYIKICHVRICNVQVDGNYFLNLYDTDTKEKILEKTGHLKTGKHEYFNIYGTMPNRNWNLKLECGHII